MVCLLGLVLWLLKEYVGPQHDPTLRKKLIELASEDVRNVRIQRGDLDAEFERDGEGWHIVRPVQARANPGSLDRMLSVLEGLVREDVVSEEERRERELTLEHYGLTDPRARLTVGNGLRQIELKIGNDAPLGGQMFVQIEGYENVMASSKGLFDALPEDLAAIRDRRVLAGTAPRTIRLEIDSPAGGFLKLVRSPAGWVFQQPDVGRGDDVRIARLLDAIYALQVQTFVEDAKVEAAGADEAELEGTRAAPTYEQYDLAGDKAVLRVRVFMHGDGVGRELLLGKATGENAGLIYARQSEIPSVYAVRRDILDAVSVSVNDLRSRRLFEQEPRDVSFVVFERDDHRLLLRRGNRGAWRIEAPVQWPADYQVVQQTLEALTRIDIKAFADPAQTNLVRLGLSPPAWRVTLAKEAPTADGASGDATVGERGEPKDVLAERRLWIGHKRRGQEGVFVGVENRILAMTEASEQASETFIFLVDSEPLASLAARATDPLVYRNRTMLALESKHVSRLSLRRGMLDQSVERDETGAWTPVDVATNVANKLAIDAALFHLANLRATSIVAHNPKAPEQFGLVTGSMSLTIGLSGGGGIQKTLLMGSTAGQDGVYAMVQGQDVVFVLPGRVVAQLGRELHRPSGTVEQRALFEVPPPKPGKAAIGGP